MSNVIEVEDLRKCYGATRAVDGVSFCVEQGEVFGMVGPNGAGKTTTIECVEGLRRPDAGRIRVLGADPAQNREAVVSRIGVQLQQANLPPRLRVGEALDLFGAFYPKAAATSDLLERLGLVEKRRAPIAKLSGGQRQRLFIALALVSQPELVFLDELTTGLDPQARRSMWDLVREMRAQGRTIFLTTHFMEEAERLCDRVAILDRGKIVALDRPEALVRSLGECTRVVFTLPPGAPAVAWDTVPGVQRVEPSGDRLAVEGAGDQFVSRVVQELEVRHIAFRDLRTEQPTLEDVFLRLTGRAMRE
jgi:ABC-2 type transport system ATP-binding protein